MDLEQICYRFENALLVFDKKSAYQILEEFLSYGNGIDFIDLVIVNVLETIGMKWERGDVSLSQVYMGSKLCEEISEKLLLELPTKNRTQFKIAIVTLEDYHTLGKKIVSTMLRAAGYELIDYGHGVKAQSVVERARMDKLDVLMISVLMYNSALRVGLVSSELKKTNPEIKIIVGGAPFLVDKSLWEKVGADATGINAAEGLHFIEKWMNGK